MDVNDILTIDCWRQVLNEVSSDGVLERYF